MKSLLRSEVPVPLRVAVALTALESLALLVQGVSLAPTLADERLTMGLTSMAFFFIYGGFLGFCAWQLYGLHSWARAPIVLAQLIQLLVGINFWGGGTTPFAVALVGVAVAVLVGVFHRDSLAALEPEG